MLLKGNVNTIFPFSGFPFLNASGPLGFSSCVHRTSADGNLAGPAAVGAANAVLGTPREKITQLTGVDQGVAVGGQVQTHHVSVGRAPRLLAGVSWRAGQRADALSARQHMKQSRRQRTFR